MIPLAWSNPPLEEKATANRVKATQWRRYKRNLAKSSICVCYEWEASELGSRGVSCWIRFTIISRWSSIVVWCSKDLIDMNSIIFNWLTMNDTSSLIFAVRSSLFYYSGLFIMRRVRNQKRLKYWLIWSILELHAKRENCCNDSL